MSHKTFSEEFGERTKVSLEGGIKTEGEVSLNWDSNHGKLTVKESKSEALFAGGGISNPMNPFGGNLISGEGSLELVGEKQGVIKGNIGLGPLSGSIDSEGNYTCGTAGKLGDIINVGFYTEGEHTILEISVELKIDNVSYTFGIKKEYDSLINMLDTFGYVNFDKLFGPEQNIDEIFDEASKKLKRDYVQQIDDVEESTDPDRLEKSWALSEEWRQQSAKLEKARHKAYSRRD